MSPAEAAALLRRYNEWHRGGDIKQPGLLAVGEAIDAAVEMISRLEDAEKECDALRAMLEDERKEHSYTLRAAKAEAKQVDALLTKIAEMERDLRLIAETDPVDAALDPQRAVRIARAALKELK